MAIHQGQRYGLKPPRAIEVLRFWSVIAAVVLVSVMATYSQAQGIFKLPPALLFKDACPAPAVIHDRDHYYICMLPDRKLPVWIGYELNKKLLSGTAERKDDFRPDLKLGEKNRALLSDYEGSGFDRGHMAEAELFKRSKQAMSNSFLLSNMAPQTTMLNRGRWKSIEKDVRDWVSQSDRALVITGNMFLDKNEKPTKPSRTIGADLHVPTHNFKAILWQKADETEAIGILIQNRRKRNPGPNSRYVVEIDKLERILGNDFFGFLPMSVQTEIEREFTIPIIFK